MNVTDALREARERKFDELATAEFERVCNAILSLLNTSDLNSELLLLWTTICSENELKEVLVERTGRRWPAA